MNIITVTVNPAIDLHLSCPDLKLGRYQTASDFRRDCAGKGVNVSRALFANGIKNLCCVILGEDGAESYVNELRPAIDELEYTCVPGRVRENVNVQHGDRETVIASCGPAVDKDAVGRMSAALAGRIDASTVLIFSGSVSEGSDREAILGFLYDARSRGASIIIDSKAFSLEEIIPLRPLLIKPNEEEAEALCGIPVNNLDDAERVAELIRSYGCENVLLTLGSRGATLASPYGLFSAESPKISVKSTVGAGDSTVAGFVGAYSNGKCGAELLANAMAFGSAACEEEGSLPPRKERVAELLPKIMTSVSVAEK